MFTLFVRRHFDLIQLALTQFRPDRMKLIVRDFGCLISADQLELLLQILINIHFAMVFFLLFSRHFYFDHVFTFQTTRTMNIFRLKKEKSR